VILYDCNARYDGGRVDWLLLTYRLPSEPSRHRVAVWRELRRTGAVGLQQATWAVPARRDFAEVVSKVSDLVDAAGGEFLSFRAAPSTEAIGARLEELFSAQREEEWTEFLSECAKFDAEIAKEIRIRKFTPAELDEEEQNLERLRRWFRELQRRDVFSAPSQTEAELRLKECEGRLEEFAARVYEYGGER
jgi:DNA-binding transcriptional regulator PaaX